MHAEESITRLFANTGIRILRQERASVELQGEMLNFIGVDDSQPDISPTEHLVMALMREPDRRTDTSMVKEVPYDVVEPLRVEITLSEYNRDYELTRQLGQAKLRVAANIPVRYFAAYADSEPAAWCELRERDGIGQIEDVNTLERFRGRGLGRALVQGAADAAKQDDDLVWLEALADDWPRELYAKLGFELVDRRHLFLLDRAP